MFVFFCKLLFNFQALEYSDDEEEANARASKKKERYIILYYVENNKYLYIWAELFKA